MDNTKYLAACASIAPHFDTVANKLKAELKEMIMTCDAEQVKEIQTKYAYLNELSQLLMNEVLHNGRI